MPRANNDAQYLNRLQDYHRQHRALPTMTAMTELLGLSSTATVFEMVGRLKTAGYLTQNPDRRLAPGRRFFARPLLGAIRAGQPEPAEEVASELTIDEALVQQPDRTVLLRVKGDSMCEAGILDGDTVVVEKGSPATVGDIVVAIVDGEYTVKRLARTGGRFYLKSANSVFPDIKPRERLELYGLVVGVFRSYGGAR